MVDLLTLTYRWNLAVKLRWGDKICAILNMSLYLEMMQATDVHIVTIELL